MKHLKLFENYDEGASEVYFYIEDGSKKAIVKIAKSDGKWREQVIRGEVPYGFGRKNYQSYLKPADIQTWLQRDYDTATMIDPSEFDEYLQEGDENTDTMFYIFDKKEFPDSGDFTAVNKAGDVWDVSADGTVTSVGNLDRMAISKEEFFEDAEGPIEMDELPDEIKDIVEDDDRF